MKTAKWKMIPAALALVLMTTMFTACGDKKEGAGANDQANVKHDPVDITFYRPNNSTTEEQFMALMGDAVKAKFPYVNVKFIPFGTGTKVEEVITAGLDLDIVLLSVGFMPGWTKYGLDYDLTEQIKKNKFDLNKLEQSQLEYVKTIGNGKINALPIFTTAAVLNYNKDVFDKFGVAYPKDGMTWDETYDLAKKLSRNDAGVQYYGLLSSLSHMYRVNQLSLPLVDSKTQTASLTSDNFRKWFDNWTRFYRIPGAELPKDKQGKEGTLFFKDKVVGMYPYFNSALLNESATEAMDAVTLPTFPGSKAGSQMYTTFSMVSNTSKNKDVAFEILAYLTSEEMQMKYAKDGTGLPVIKNQKVIDAFGSNMPQYKGKNIKSFYPENPAPISVLSEYYDLALKYAGSAYNEVVQGGDVVTALRKAEELANKDIEGAKAATK